MIRAYQAADAAAFTAVHNTIFPHQPHTRHSWQAHVDRILRIDGRAWTLIQGEQPIAYAAVVPVPGLPGLVELEGFVAVPWQRQGWGTRLLAHVKEALAGTAVTQLSVPVPHLHTPAASFLLKNGFFIEHEEWMMECSRVNGQWLMVNDSLHANCHLQTYPAAVAIPLFCELYAACFTGLPWNQPFTNTEVAADLRQSDDLLFLFAEEAPVGFVWVRPHTATAVQLEPIGIIPQKQGQGYGRTLLQLVLTQLAKQGVTTVNLGVWANNTMAVHLYQSLGFQQTGSIVYLAYNLEHDQHPVR